MEEPLQDWPREHFEPGDDTPYLFYAVFGATTDGLKLSRTKYRCDEIPDGLDLMSYGPGSHPEMLDEFRSGYLWEQLRETQPQLARTIAAEDRCILIRGELDDARDLNYFRNTIGLVTCLLDNGGVGIHDPQSFRWWSAEDWRDNVFDPGKALPRQHVVILVSEEPDGTQWFHTRGLRKFGRPDLSIHNVPSRYRDAIVDLCNRFIEFQAFGGVIADGQEIRMGSLPSGMYCRRDGSMDDPDFNNVHVEVMWPDI